MNIKNFMSSLTGEDLIVTANRRLSVYLQKNHDLLQIETGKTAWQSLNILPLSAWIELLWETFSNDHRILLTDFQESIIWENIITESSFGETLLNTDATARLARDSWRLLHHWLLELKDIEGSSSLDVQTFIGWSKAFQEKSDQHDYLSRGQILKLLIKKLESAPSTFQLPRKIFFIGFDEMSPALRKFQKILKTKSEIQNIFFTQETKANIGRISFEDKHHEFQEMARYAYQKLLDKKDALIGCVIPNLTQNRNQIIRTFEDVYYAEGWEKHFSSKPFNISAADSLSHFPLIQVALKVLALNLMEINLEDFCCILRTPFTKGADTEINQRAILDTKLRSFGEKKLSVKYLIEGDVFSNSSPILHASLQQFLVISTKALGKKMSLQNWVTLFAEQLNALGWPGERTLNSTEFQLVERFKKLLTEFVSLSSFVGEINLNKSLQLLNKLISATLFQPKSDDQPIQILGMLEATGISFDHLWIAGLDNETWPAPSSPSPFIPIEIQKKNDMPHATSERELQFSLGVTKRFIHNATNIIFSHTEFDGDRPLSPSPLIIDYPITAATASSYVSLEEQIFAEKKIEYFIDEVGPSVKEELISGGSSIFKAQAACPFQAFATFRLHAQPLDDTQMGLAFHERGSLVHDILASLWNNIKSHEQLCSLQDDALNKMLSDIIQKSLNNIRSKKPFTLNKELLNLEKNRLQKLIYNWLQIEKKRQPFEVVSCEERQTAQIGKLAIHIQIDRIDRLIDGSHLIIDYKTGKPSILDWFSDKPNEPQLPLYTILCNELLSGILFAQIRLDDMNFKGLTSFPDIVPGAITLDRLKGLDFQNMKTLIDYWKNILEQLADDFCQGKAKVEPKDASACQYCQLHELCRVNHASAQQEIKDE